MTGAGPLDCWIGNRRSNCAATGNQQLATSNQQPATCNWQWVRSIVLFAFRLVSALDFGYCGYGLLYALHATLVNDTRCCCCLCCCRRCCRCCLQHHLASSAEIIILCKIYAMRCQTIQPTSPSPDHSPCHPWQLPASSSSFSFIRFVSILFPTVNTRKSIQFSFSFHSLPSQAACSDFSASSIAKNSSCVALLPAEPLLNRFSKLF